MQGDDRFAIMQCTTVNPYSVNGCNLVDVYGYPGDGGMSNNAPGDPAVHDFSNGRAYRLTQYTTPRNIWQATEWDIETPQDASNCSPGDRSDQQEPSSKTSKSSKSSKKTRKTLRRTNRNLGGSVQQHSNLRGQ
jgi:hypothetical protein